MFRKVSGASRFPPGGIANAFANEEAIVIGLARTAFPFSLSFFPVGNRADNGRSENIPGLRTDDWPAACK